MATIESVILNGTVRVRRGVNADQMAVLDTQRAGYGGLSFEESPQGVRVYLDGELMTLVAWQVIRQVVYAPTAPSAETRPETPAAKGKAA